MYLVAGIQELLARTTGKPALLSWAAVRSLHREAGRTRFDHSKSERELGLVFRPAAETVRDTVAWLWTNGLAPTGGQHGRTELTEPLVSESTSCVVSVWEWVKSP